MQRHVTMRPSSRPAVREGRPARLLVLLAVAALLVGCANPTPQPAGPSADPTAVPAASEGPAASPSGTPTPSAAPGEAGWQPITDLLPLAPVATFEPTRAVAAGVLPDTAFRLAALDGSDPVALAHRLVAEPPVDLDIRPVDGAALVTPRAPLAAGAYRFALRAADGSVRASWAVQALGPLAVTGAIPADESTGVPVDTGIELTFNQPGVTAADVEAHLAIEPRVAGHVQVEGRTAAFIPDRPLATATLYAVTVRAGLPLAGTDESLPADRVLRFETTGTPDQGVFVRFANGLTETSPADHPAFRVAVLRYADDGGRRPPTPTVLPVTISRLADLDAAVAGWRRLRDAPDWTRSRWLPIDPAGLPVAFAGDVRLHRLPGTSWQRVARLPVTLDVGWYLVTATSGGRPAQAILQVTDLALYTAVTTTRTVAWVNDTGAGTAVRNAQVTIDGTDLGRTGADGILVARTPDRIIAIAEGRLDPEDGSPALQAGARATIILARSGARAVFAPAFDNPACAKCDDAPDPSAAWWLVFEPDRYQYRSTDTLNAWGTLRRREDGTVPETVDLVLAAALDDGGPVTPIARATAHPDRTGTFVGSLAFTDAPYDQYVLQLRVDDVVVAERWVSVGRILKPGWTMRLATDRHAVIEGTRLPITATARFYEGTPVAGVDIVVDGTSGSQRLHTDLAGTATGSVRLRLEGDWSQWEVIGIDARPRLPEEGEIPAEARVAVFHAGVIVKSDAVIDDRRLVVTGTVHEVALDRFERASQDTLWDVDPYGATVANRSVSVRVTEHWTVRHRVGSTYDWIEKRVVPRYRYEPRSAVVGTTTVRTDGAGRFRLTLPADPDRSYELALTTHDAQGRRTVGEAWAEGPQVVSEDTTPYVAFEGHDEGWSIGDRVELTFRNATPTRDARWLWIGGNDGLRSWAITDTPALVDRFGTDDVPGYTVIAVEFTGSAYVPAEGPARVDFHERDRTLHVELTPDRAHYAPGDPATLTVRTTDAAGRPVAASVYVGVIDEKLVTMGIANLGDPLGSLYADSPSGILGTAVTHRDQRAELYGEGGDTTGGGGDTARADFRDWLVARLVHTGDDGRASIAFDLSDDLTSWRAFAAGVTRSLEAGSGEASLPVSLPFFAEVTLAESYLAADRPVVRLRAYGTGLHAADTVTFTVSSDTLPMGAVTVTAPAFRAAEVALPALSVGTQRLRIVATTGSGSGARRDALVRTFTVVAHRAVQADVTWSRLAETMSVPAGTGSTTLTLADAGRGRVVPILEALAVSDPGRGDRALAAGVAARVLRDSFGLDAGTPALDLDVGAFTRNGGYALLPYADPELELTALAAMAGDPRIGALDDWFSWQDATTREARYWVLAGRAASGASVLAEIREAAARPDLSTEEQVALALAALAAGDDALAGRLERDVLAAAGERRGPYVRVRAEAVDASRVLTARLAIVAASLGDDVAVEMDAFVEAHPPTTTSVALERALAAQGWARRVPAADTTASLTVDGSTQVLSVTASRPVTVSLTPAQAAGARLAPATGTILVVTRFDRPLDARSLEPPDWLTIARTVRPAGRIGIDDVVAVELTMPSPPAGDGCWAVTEFVPSGLIPVTEPGRVEEFIGGDAIGPWSIEGQRLDFCAGRNREHPTVRMVYVARVVTPGRYAWEPGVVQSPLEPGVGAVIPATEVTIDGEG